jgi:hypothetical protein
LPRTDHTSYNASVVKIYNTPNSLVCYCNNFNPHWNNTQAYIRQRECCTYIVVNAAIVGLSHDKEEIPHFEDCMWTDFAVLLFRNSPVYISFIMKSSFHYSMSFRPCSIFSTLIAMAWRWIGRRCCKVFL